MAHNSNAAQEPNMDELLASIREIIEENAGLSAQDTGRQNAGNSSRPVRMDTRNRPAQQAAEPEVSVQDAMNALAERIGLRKSAASAHENSAGTAAAQPRQQPKPPVRQPMGVVRDFKPETAQNVSHLKPQKTMQPKRPLEVVRDTGAKEMSEAERSLRADVERSAELVLRPYINQWLEEHFRQVFEKVMREEMQRFIQALRR